MKTFIINVLRLFFRHQVYTFNVSEWPEGFKMDEPAKPKRYSSDPQSNAVKDRVTSATRKAARAKVSLSGWPGFSFSASSVTGEAFGKRGTTTKAIAGVLSLGVDTSAVYLSYFRGFSHTFKDSK